jgi:hypothetical protein
VDLTFATGEKHEVLRGLGALHRALAELEDLGLLDDEVTQWAARPLEDINDQPWPAILTWANGAAPSSHWDRRCVGREAGCRNRAAQPGVADRAQPTSKA